MNREVMNLKESKEGYMKSFRGREITQLCDNIKILEIEVKDKRVSSL